MPRRRTTKRNHGALSSCSKKLKTNDFGPWSSDLNDDVLLLIMMRLGVIDFLAFSKVCKSWRSLAWTNRQRFMASKPPMLMQISTRGSKNKECCLEDHEGRKFKTILPCSAGRFFIGKTTGGYLIFFRRKTKEFWLVNPITSHTLYFPPVPMNYTPYSHTGEPYMSSVLVFLPSISAWVLVMLNYKASEIWFCIDGEGLWSRVPSTLYIQSLHIFNNQIYTICCCSENANTSHYRVGNVHELAFKPEPKLILLKTKNLSDKFLVYPELVSWGENLYTMQMNSQLGRACCLAYKLDFDEMKWVPFQDTRDELAFFLIAGAGRGNIVVTGEQGSWAVSPSRYEKVNVATNVFQGRRVFIAKQGFKGYFAQMNVSVTISLLDES